MGIELNEDFRYRFKNGGGFSGKDAGFLVVESLGLSRKGDVSRLQLSLHLDFICAVLQMKRQCFCLVESPSDRVLEELKSVFPDHQVLNGSILGYFEFDRKLIARFWTVFETADQIAPWKNEASWVVGNTTENLPIPSADSLLRRPYWSVEHVLRNCESFDSIFVQSGWFAFFAIRPFKGAREFLQREFPELKDRKTSAASNA